MTNQDLQNMTPEQRTQAILNFMLEDYADKRSKGVIYFEMSSSEGLVMFHKQFDAKGEAVDPLKLPFTQSNLNRIKIQRRQQRDQLEMQRIGIDEQLEKFDTADKSLYDLLEADIELETEKAQKNPQKVAAPASGSASASAPPASATSSKPPE